MKAFLSICMCFIMLLVGCNTSNVSPLVTALNVIANSTSAVIVITEALVAVNEMTPQDAAVAAQYAQAAATAANNSITELNSTTDSNVQKITYITQQFALVAVPAFGPTVSPEVTIAINVVATAINSFLAQLNSSTTVSLARVVPAKTVNSALANSAADQKLLKQIQKTCNGIIQQAQTLEKK